MPHHGPRARRSFAPLFPADTTPADLDTAMLEGSASFLGDPATGIVRMVVASGGARVKAVLTPDMMALLMRAGLDAMRAAGGQPPQEQLAPIEAAQANGGA
ncbi:hypothetical protein [Pararhodobacter marinus]|uniref:hypothetical protein n=1 Tax=Pararhodobacter marinus TaxID=2184063 RepID=UPI003518636B